MLGRAPRSLRGGTFVPGKSCIKDEERGWGGRSLGMRPHGAQVRRHFHLEGSLAWVGLGRNAHKAPFLPEECACSGLTGLPKNDRQRVNYIGLLRT